MGLSAVATTRRYGATLRLFLDTDRANDFTGVSVVLAGETSPRCTESIDDIAASALAQGY
jgi:hypothetical protein